MKHIAEDDVVVWLLTDKRIPDDATKHAESCDLCQQTIRHGEQFLEIVRDPSLWGEKGNETALLPALAELEALEERLLSEQRDAEELANRVSIEELESHIIVSGSSVGMVRALIDRSFEQVEKDPNAGAKYAELSVISAQLLRDSDHYDGVLIQATRGQAWRQRANAYRMQGRLPDALADLDSAETAFLKTVVPDPEIASLQYIRATIYYEQGNFSEARPLLESASAVFREFGDDTRYRNAILLLAGVLERLGEQERSIEMTHEFLKACPRDDSVFRARILNQLGDFLITTDPARAEPYLQQARYCFRTAGLRTEALRSLWNLGRAARNQNNPDRASEIFEEAYQEAISLGLQIDAALIALDRAEIFLERDEPHLVAALCADAIRTFRSAGAPRFAAEAFAYLATAAKRERISRDHLEFVRTFVTDAAQDPDRHFTPPPN